ncbi:MAG: hypothetical protein HY902_01365 [Deltaproteobacteria bacterium]|nr:hypothetical protein [Deltaproteobacteria bacterium]
MALRALAVLAAAVCLPACSGAAVQDEPKRAGAPDIAPREAPRADPKPADAPRDSGQPAVPAADPKPAEPAPDPVKPAKPAAMPTALGDVSTFPEGTPDGTLRAALACALDDLGDSQAFQCYASLNVSRNRDTDIAVAQLRAYNWKHFRQYAASYVVRDKPFTVRITRRDLDANGGDGKVVKLFLYSKSRDYPAPITLEREGGAWRISYNSL